MTLPGPDEWPVDSLTGDAVPDPSGDLLRLRSEATPDRTAVIDADTGDWWSYAAFDERASGRAERLDEFATEADARVGLLLGARPAFAEVYFAAGRLGASVVPLNVDRPAADLRDQAERADLDCLVCGASTADLAVEVAPSDVSVASVDDPDRDGVVSLDGRPSPGPSAVGTPLDAERVLLFTSGTTGAPKGVRLTRRNLVASAVGSADRLGVDPDDRWLVCLPMYHMGGLAPLVRSTLYGTTTVIQRSFDAGATARAMDEYDVTGVSLVPTMLTRLLDAEWSPPDSLRFVLLGGAPASEGLIERALDRGVPAYPTYGATETASQVATATPREAVDHPGTVGRPLSTVDASIRAVDGGEGANSGDAPVEPGDRGEIVVSGPTVTPGYLDAAHTEAAFDAAGFHTGDLGYRDGDGRLWVVGRLDDRIVTGGENVHPERVVAALTDLAGVDEAAVVGLPDEEWGERVAALAVPAGEAPSAGEVRDAVRGGLPDFAVPKTVAFADALPRTASGTVDREAVAERLRERAAADGDG